MERDTQEEIQEVEGDIFEEEDMNVSTAFVSARPRMETLEQVQCISQAWIICGILGS